MVDTKDNIGVAASSAPSELSSQKAASTPSTSNPGPTAKPLPLWRKLLGYVWDTESQTDPEYRRYVQRLDRIFFPTVLLGYFIKYLDQTNYSNAFVSGM